MSARTKGLLAVLAALVAFMVGLMLLVQMVMGAFGAGSGSMTAAALAAAKTDCGTGGNGGGTGAIIPIDASKAPGQWNASQKANAAAIVEQVNAEGAIAAKDKRHAAIIALSTAMQESSLTNVGYGDTAGPDSRGLFQQRAPWGPLADRMDPHKSAHMFLTGGQGGQRGLTGVSGWQGMPVWLAAQTVQVSAFPTAYAKWEGAATALADALLSGAPAPSASPSAAPSASTQPVSLSCVGNDPAVPSGPSGPVSKTGWGNPMPAGSWVMTSPFGWRMHPVVHAMRLHTGDDLAAPFGTPVYAVHDGTVAAAAPNDGYGNQVVISHGGGADSAYNHLSAILAKVGDKVKAGQLVGKVGSTGMSTGNHLHFEIRLNGKPIDPVPFMAARGVKLDVT